MNRQITILFCLIFLISCNNNPTSKSQANDVIGNPKKILYLEVAEYDFKTRMNWHDANKSCNELGDGWRLPTSDELTLMYQYNSLIEPIDANTYYWSSSYTNIDSTAFVTENPINQKYDTNLMTANVLKVVNLRPNQIPYADVTNKDKNLAFLSVRAVKGNAPNPIIGKTIKIGNLEIAEHDFPLYHYGDAEIKCKELGNGWRLPNKEELNILYINKQSIGGFLLNDNRSDSYWSSSDDPEFGKVIQDFFSGKIYNGDPGFGNASSFCHVRAVRSIK